MVDILSTILSHPFTWGLAVGLLFAAGTFVSGWSARRRLQRENRRLADHCRTAAELNAEGTHSLQEKVAGLEKMNKNLEITVAALKNKPDRAELQKLYVLDRAAALMTERAPGFAAVWQSALQEAQAEMDKTSSGILPWFRRIIHPSLAGGSGGTDRALPPGGGEGHGDFRNGE